MYLIGLDIDSKVYKRTHEWMEKCKVLKGNKEGTNLYMNSYKEYRSSYGYNKNENFSTNKHNPYARNSGFGFCCMSPTKR